MLLLSVNHHYIRDRAPPRGIYPISLDIFRSRIDRLLGAYQIVTERELIDSFGARQPEGHHPSLLLTFDDGLAEQMNAARWLDSHGLTAVFFVPTAPIVESRLLTVHRTHLLRSIATDEALLELLEKRFGKRMAEAERAHAANQYIYDDPSAQQLKYILNFVLPPSDADAFVKNAFDNYCGSEAAAAKELYMSRDDIRWLSDRGMLGTHAHSHRALAQLSPQDIEREIALSVDVLNEITGRKILGISYPYGGPTAVSTEVYRIARESDLRYGYTMMRAFDRTETAAPFALHRYDTQDIELLSS